MFQDHDLMVDQLLSVDDVHEVVLMVVLNMELLRIALAPLLLEHFHVYFLVDLTLRVLLYLHRRLSVFNLSTWVVNVLLTGVLVETEVN